VGGPSQQRPTTDYYEMQPDVQGQLPGPLIAWLAYGTALQGVGAHTNGRASVEISHLPGKCRHFIHELPNQQHVEATPPPPPTGLPA
jgi:hypothetical protein